jgi:hypothetical protein
MAHERIWCDTADPTWHVTEPGDEVQAPYCKPGIHVQWHDLGGVSMATGDLNAEYLDNFAELPANSVNLRDFLPEPEDSDTARAYEHLAKAIREAVTHAYDAGVAVPRHVWLDRQNCNHVVRAVRRGRNTAFGADE